MDRGPRRTTLVVRRAGQASPLRFPGAAARPRPSGLDRSTAANPRSARFEIEIQAAGSCLTGGFAPRALRSLSRSAAPG